MKRLGKTIKGGQDSTGWGHDAERTAANPFGCPCGGDHTRAKGEQKVAPLEMIVDASIKAKGATEYRPELRTWISKIRGPAYVIGTEKGAGFFEKLHARLNVLLQEELDMQMRATKISPKDTEGGIHHGWMRGCVEEAIARLQEADKYFRELKAFETRLAERARARSGGRTS